MSRYDVVIIGSGMGGLACGAILSKEGMRVCVVEKNRTAGGCLQSFRRGGCTLDTGIHYVGSLGEGQTMHQYLKYFGILPRITLRQLDAEGFDLIHIEGRTFRHAIGYDRFAERLTADFPAEREGIAKYCTLLRNIGSSIAPEVLRSGRLSAGATEYLGVSAAATIDGLVSDPLLRRVLAGSAPLYGGRRDMSPLYHHAMINHSNIEGAACFVGGTQRVADALADVIRADGGELLCGARASRLLLGAEGRITGVELNDGEQVLDTRWVISDIAPAATFALAGQTPLLKRAFLNRMNSLPSTYGLFTAHIRLQPGTLAFRNRNHYLYNTPDVWGERGDFEGYNIPMVLLCTQPSPREPQWAEVITLMVPMRIAAVERWLGSRPRQRGADYEEFKARFAAATLRFAGRFFPQINDRAELLCTSTPLTYLDYTGTPEGSAYGLQKDFNRPVSSLIPVRSRIANLLLTGQNLNVHGMLGVTLSAALTCSELVGEEYLAKKIGYA